MSSDRSSLAKALHSEADQLSMFGADASAADIDSLRGEDGRLPSDAFRRLRMAPAARRGPGRPLGSVNKRSEQLAKIVIQEFGDPVLGGASLYAMPLDQVCEMLLIADGSVEREEKLADLTARVGEQVTALVNQTAALVRAGDAGDVVKAIDKLAEAAEKLQDVARKQGKPGALALAALNTQLMARKFVAEYVHSKRPVAHEVNVRSDGLLVMPKAGVAEAEAVAAKLNELVLAGRIEPDQVARLEYRDGQLFDPEGEIEEADYEEVSEPAGDDG